MLQLSLCVSGVSSKVIEDVKREIKSNVINCGGVFSVFEKNNFLYFLIVCDNQNQENVATYIKKGICDCILNSFKCDYIQSLLKYDFPKDIKYYTLLEALLNFDRRCDEMYILDKIDLSGGEFYVQSFYHFNCKLLKEKWFQLVQITNQNAKLLNVEENYLEVLRFLLDGIDKDCSIEIVGQNDKFKVSKKGDIVLFDSYKNLIKYIIKTNPKKLYVKNLDEHFVNFIKQLFLSRVTISL